MPKLQESKGRFSLTIPQEYVQRMGWKKGQRVVMGFNERGHIEIQ